jgi:hypothetical protein
MSTLAKRNPARQDVTAQRGAIAPLVELARHGITVAKLESAAADVKSRRHTKRGHPRVA